ncbi:hypothetical protein [Pseudalkalibacillus sp. JSM 102089]|uniref:hypothetical protein n=1 Tax=Pseudalkalibacillus sp. JSM 102089 TaxID=3229856 RepID=UPI00352332B0
MKLNHKVNLIIHRKKIYIILIGFVLVGCYFANINPIKYSANIIYRIIPIDLSDPAIAALFGALIGGILSFIGSVYTQRKSFKNKGVIVRKNVIYSPLFDDLTKFKNSMDQYKKDNDYPIRLIFSTKDYHEMYKRNSFLAWERITSDVRSIEMPRYLTNELESLIDLGEKYIESLNKADEEIYQGAVEILAKVDTQLRDKSKSLVPTFLHEILIGNSITEENLNQSLYGHLDDGIKAELFTFYDSAKQFESINIVTKDFNEFHSHVTDLVVSISKLINFIQEKFEHKNKFY